MAAGGFLFRACRRTQFIERRQVGRMILGSKAEAAFSIFAGTRGVPGFRCGASPGKFPEHCAILLVAQFNN
jgi:hypothetical protein